MKKGYKIHFNLDINDRDEYASVIDITRNELVPWEKSPVEYLRERVNAELDRMLEQFNWAEDAERKWPPKDNTEETHSYGTTK